MSIIYPAYWDEQRVHRLRERLCRFRETGVEEGCLSEAIECLYWILNQDKAETKEAQDTSDGPIGMDEVDV